MKLLLAIVVMIAAQTRPATAPSSIDPNLWQRLVEIDRRASAIQDLSANFRQEKLTTMLKKPLVSAGTIAVKGSAMLWDTKSPEPTIMCIDEKEVRLYYPQQKSVEIYPINERLGALAASPLPRLSVLREHFSFTEIPPSDVVDKDAEPPASSLALRLIPTDPELKEHLESVLVLLDERSGLILRAVMTDPDGDRTVLAFSDVKTNGGIKNDALQLNLPSDVKIVHPLEGFDPASAPRRAK